MKLIVIRMLAFLFRKSSIGNALPVLALAHYINNIVPKPDFIYVNNKKIFIHKVNDVVSNSLYYYNEWEPIETRLFKKLIKDGDTVLDVGAHIGYYTLVASELVGKNGKVFSFEPDLDNFALLQKCVTVNKLRNVVIVNKAVSNMNKRIRLYLSDENRGDHRISIKGNKTNFIQIDSITLDKYFIKSNLHIDFVKLDIQGAEKNALQGMSKILQNNKNIILILEYWPYAGNYSKELLDILIHPNLIPSRA